MTYNTCTLFYEKAMKNAFTQQIFAICKWQNFNSARGIKPTDIKSGFRLLVSVLDQTCVCRMPPNSLLSSLPEAAAANSHAHKGTEGRELARERRSYLLPVKNDGVHFMSAQHLFDILFVEVLAPDEQHQPQRLDVRDEGQVLKKSLSLETDTLQQHNAPCEE